MEKERKREKCKETTDPTFPPYSACLSFLSHCTQRLLLFQTQLSFSPGQPLILSYTHPLMIFCVSNDHPHATAPSRGFLPPHLFQEFQMPIPWSPQVRSIPRNHLPSLTPGFSNIGNGFTTPSHSSYLCQKLSVVSIAAFQKPHPNNHHFHTDFSYKAQSLSLSLLPPSPLCPASIKYHKGPGESKYLCTLPLHPSLPLFRVCVQSDRPRA